MTASLLWKLFVTVLLSSFFQVLIQVAFRDNSHMDKTIGLWFDGTVIVNYFPRNRLNANRVSNNWTMLKRKKNILWDMNSGMKVIYPYRLGEGISLIFLEDYVHSIDIWRTQRLRCCDNNNKNEDISPNVNNDNFPFQKFIEITKNYVHIEVLSIEFYKPFHLKTCCK